MHWWLWKFVETSGLNLIYLGTPQRYLLKQRTISQLSGKTFGAITLDCTANVYRQNEYKLKKPYVICLSFYIQNMGCFIYILDISISTSFKFWSSQFASSSRSNWTGNSNGTWTDKQSSHFGTAKEIRVKATFFHVTITTNKFRNGAEMMLKSFWTSHLQMMNRPEPLF